MHNAVSGLILLITLTAPAAARSESDWYAAFGLGWNFSENLKLGDNNGHLEFDFGVPIGTLTLGRRINDDWRMEIDASYRETDLEILQPPNPGEALNPDADDSLHSLSGQLSILRDFQLGLAFRPYLGAGLGPARVQLKLSDRDTLPREVLIDDEQWALAWQLIAGFTLPLADRWDLAADYRFWQVPSLKLTDEAGNALDLTHSVHSGTLHLRYLFGGRRGPTAVAMKTIDEGIYLSANLGLGFATDAEVSDSRENFDAFKVGPFGSLALGRGFGKRWRLELELARRRNDVEILDLSLIVGQFGADGQVVADSIMANGMYRFRPGRAIRPTLGFGVGAAFADYKVSIADEPYLDDEATGMALQVLLGVDVAVTERLAFTADYRSWLALGLQMRRPDGDPLETSQWVNTMSLGVRYALR